MRVRAASATPRGICGRIRARRSRPTRPSRERGLHLGPPVAVPELPEVETTARGLRERIVGKQIVAAGGMDWERMLPNATPALIEAAVVGRTVESVDRRGKYVLIGLSGD